RRQRRRRGIAIPAAGAALGVKIIAQGLLVETRLRLAGLVGVHRPEAGAVRRHHLIDQDDASVPIAAELELGVGDDDALLPRSRRSSARRASPGRVWLSSVWAPPSPPIPRIRALVMFSSCPVPAWVAGLKFAGSSLPFSRGPASSFSPASVPCAAYSFQAEP